MTTLLLSLPILRSGLIGQERPPAPEKIAPVMKNMLDAALGFLDALSPALREKVLLPFEDKERFNWHYVPTMLEGLPEPLRKLFHERRGVSLQEMSGPERTAAHALLRSVLSTQGYLKATGIMIMEEVLRETELALGKDVWSISFDPKVISTVRNPELYFFTIFGRPSGDTAWGWRVEGHHLSLHFSSVTGELMATTPMFMGSNPAVVPHGTHAGLSLLAAEAGLARELMNSFDAQQSARAIIAASAPEDIITGNNRKASLETMAGLSASNMSGVQRALLIRLIQEYAANLRPDLADAQLARIKIAEVERIHFAWAGSVEAGKPHYYRVHSQKLLIEYDNTQNNANHIHTVYRDLVNDFGEDMLRRHYEKGGHHD
jgi:hypothetical protein